MKGVGSLTTEIGPIFGRKLESTGGLNVHPRSNTNNTKDII